MISDSETRRRTRRFRFSFQLRPALLATPALVSVLCASSAFAQQAPATEAPPEAPASPTSPPPPADDPQARATARELALQGAQAFERGDFKGALEMLNRAYTLYPTPTISVMQARTLAKLGRLLEAIDKYEQTMRTKLEADAPEAFQAAITDAASEVETVRVRLPRVKLIVSGPGADSQELRVIIDGKESPVALIGVDRPIDPGKHQFVVESPEGAKGTRELEVEESRSYLVELTLEPPKTVAPPRVDPGPVQPRPQPKPDYTLAYVAFGVGGAGLALGTITGVIALGKKSDLDDACPNNSCPPSSRDDLDAYRLHRTLSYVGFGVGAVGIIGGTVLLFTAGSAPTSTQVRAYLAPGEAGISGKF